MGAYESCTYRGADCGRRSGWHSRPAGWWIGKSSGAKAEVPKFDTVDILVAKSDVQRGQTLTPADVFWQAWPATTASGNFIRRTDRPKAIENLNGMIVRAPFVAGEPIREAKLVNSKGSGFMAAILPTGMRAISTQISPETGAGGFILPNDRVDVILTPRANRDANASGQAETLALSQQLGTLSLALRSLADSAADDSKSDESDARRNVNVVRFGVSHTTTPR